MWVIAYLKYKNASRVGRLISLVVTGGVFALLFILAIFFTVASDSLTGYVGEDTAIYVRISFPRMRDGTPLEKLAPNLLSEITGKDFSDLPINYIKRELAVLLDNDGNSTVLIKAGDYIGLNQYLDNKSITHLNCKFDLIVVSDSQIHCPEKSSSGFIKDIRKNFSLFDSLNVYTKSGLSLRGIVRGDKLLIGDSNSKPGVIEHRDDYDFIFSFDQLSRSEPFSYQGLILPDDYLNLFGLKFENLESVFVGVKKTDREGGLFVGNDFLVAISDNEKQVEGIEELVFLELAKEYPVTREKQLTDGTIILEVVADPSDFVFNDDVATIASDVSLFRKDRGDFWVITNNGDWLNNDVVFNDTIKIDKSRMPELNLWGILDSFDNILLNDSVLNLY
jgi:hypothetical protein